jgi:hypothetical protein
MVSCFEAKDAPKSSKCVCCKVDKQSCIGGDLPQVRRPGPSQAVAAPVSLVPKPAPIPSTSRPLVAPPMTASVSAPDPSSSSSALFAPGIPMDQDYPVFNALRKRSFAALSVEMPSSSKLPRTSTLSRSAAQGSSGHSSAPSPLAAISPFAPAPSTSTPTEMAELKQGVYALMHRVDSIEAAVDGFHSDTKRRVQEVRGLLSEMSRKLGGQ